MRSSTAIIVNGSMATLIVALNSGSLGLLRELAKSVLKEEMTVKIVLMNG